MAHPFIRTAFTPMSSSRRRPPAAGPKKSRRLPAPTKWAHRRKRSFSAATGFDWNGPKDITARFTSAEGERAAAPLRSRIAKREAQLNAKT